MMLVEAIFFVVLVAFVTGIVVDRLVDGVRAFRRDRRLRMGESGRVFPVVTRMVLPYEGDGCGVYLVQGVLERTGERSDLRLDANSINDALRQALERGVSPTHVTKQRLEAAGREMRGAV